MRAQVAIGWQEDKIHLSAQKYCEAWLALVRMAKVLNKTGWEALLQELKPEDVKGMENCDNEPGNGTRRGLGEGRRTLSWIWTDLTAVSQAASDPRLHDGK